MKSFLTSFLSILLFALTASAQFQFFEQMFNGQQQQGQQQQNVRSDAEWYKQQYDAENEDKVELGDGIAICASKGGWKAGEMQRKVELARKGLL